MKNKLLPLLFLLTLTVLCAVGCSAPPAPSAGTSSEVSSGQSSTPEVAPPTVSEPDASSSTAPTPAPEQEPAVSPAPDVTPDAEPDTPVQPDTPAKPTEPEEPAKPKPPVEPDVPAEPETPAEPPVEEPSEGAEATYVYHEKVPVLMYHEVNDLLANSLYLSVADFISHLDYFEAAGVTPISMRQLYDHWFHEAPLPEKPIVLTFDDGYRSMYTTVYPLLKERGWSGTFYCISAGRWSDNFVSADMIAEMAAGGMEIGSHTDNHVELDSLSKERLIRELVDSKSILETITGQEITALCYPAGKYNADVEAAAADAGYLSAVTTRSGFSTKEQGIFALKRVRVSKDCGAAWIKNTLSPLGY